MTLCKPEIVAFEEDDDGDINFNTYVPVPNNHFEFRKEIHTGITDELTLSVMRALHEKSTVDSFLSGGCMVINLSGAEISPERLAKILHDFAQAEESE
jgi:hypothetical protein